jgi:hypothetical protein
MQHFELSARWMTRAGLALLAILLVVPPTGALAQTAAPTAQPQQTAADDSVIGSVANATGEPMVTRGDKRYSLAAGNEIFPGDVLQTGANSGLGVTFDDETTLTLGTNTTVSVSDYVYQKANTRSSAVIKVLRGTLAFIAGQVARTGDMKITTPTASLGIRGTTGIVDVPVDARGTPGETRIKLYQDQGGTVGHIEVFDNAGTRLGLLSQASTGFAVRFDQARSRSLGQPRFEAVTLRLAPAEIARDRGQVQQLFSIHTLGRQLNNIRRNGGVAPQRQQNLRNPTDRRTLPGQNRQPGQNRLDRQGRRTGLRAAPNGQRSPNLQNAQRPFTARGQRSLQSQQKSPGRGRNNRQNRYQ